MILNVYEPRALLVVAGSRVCFLSRIIGMKCIYGGILQQNIHIEYIKINREHINGAQFS